ncbi:hypothetical protein N7466_006198 [Penicillium verhagenii]|uniref:uncharacterized protein n=1 Tax=Penicillium verhagenii TaxID=1562060 RepID=UPI0025455E3B|nr:uncharacterized protein N7466_006198 [Penicillium verhagenii]KAJ5930705.1 hypothetical protein N7466_006198 [Penicillium verhagenii]
MEWQEPESLPLPGQSLSPSKVKDCLVPHFFFKQTEKERGIAKYLISTITRQFITTNRPLVPFILDALDKDPDIGSKFLGEQFDKLLYLPLMKLDSEQVKTVVIVIDALDECDGENDIKFILHLLFKLQEIKSLRLRVVLTSRPELPIRLGFDSEENHQDLVLHELPLPVIEHDIRLFLKHEMSAIQVNRGLPPDWPGNDKIEDLVQMSIPLFVFAATACLFIKKNLHPHTALERYLNIGATGATQMEQMYLPVLRQLIQDDEEQTKEALKEFQEIIGVIILLATPLSVNSLALLLQMPIQEIKDHLVFLHSVLFVPDNTNTPVRILHLSFREFLLHTDKEFRIDEKHTHRQIALHCLRIMDTRLRHNLCDLASYGLQYKDIDSQIIQQYLPADLQYSCNYWIHHLKESQGGIPESEILSFLHKRFLHWLEALALMGKVSEATGMIQILESRTWKTADPAILRFLYDARRFTLQNAYIASIAPLQLYCSGLVFAPGQSVIKRAFTSEIPKRIQRLPAVTDFWSPNLQTLEGHSGQISSVAFSPDGLTLASGSKDGTIKLWNTATGTQRQILEGGSWESINSLAFSPDGLTLASGSFDGTIELWDTATGTTQQQMSEGYSGDINSVAALGSLKTAPGNSLISLSSNWGELTLLKKLYMTAWSEIHLRTLPNARAAAIAHHWLVHLQIPEFEASKVFNRSCIRNPTEFVSVARNAPWEEFVYVDEVEEAVTEEEPEVQDRWRLD